MTISELIANLQDIMDKYGDLPVYKPQREFPTLPPTSPIVSVAYWSKVEQLEIDSIPQPDEDKIDKVVID